LEASHHRRSSEPPGTAIPERRRPTGLTRDRPNTPRRFTGVLLGARTILDEDRGESDTRVRLFRTEKGSLVWAWVRIEHGYLDPEPEQIQRSDAVVLSATETARMPAETATEAW